MTLITSIVCISPLSRLQEYFGEHATNTAASEPLDRGDWNREYRIRARGQTCEIVGTQAVKQPAPITRCNGLGPDDNHSRTDTHQHVGVIQRHSSAINSGENQGL